HRVPRARDPTPGPRPDHGLRHGRQRDRRHRAPGLGRAADRRRARRPPRRAPRRPHPPGLHAPDRGRLRHDRAPRADGAEGLTRVALWAAPAVPALLPAPSLARPAAPAVRHTPALAAAAVLGSGVSMLALSPAGQTSAAGLLRVD